jgi:predicted RNase H-like HicB family nuclease
MVARRQKHVRYTVILQEETDPNFVGYYNASVPALPGCLSYGANREEALLNIKEAIELYLEDLEANGEPIPVEHIEQIGVEV